MFSVQNVKLFRSSTFRLAVIYMLLFSLSVLVLLGFIYWSTAGYMLRQTEATIEAEITGLAERYDLSGLPGLSKVISERLSRQKSPATPSTCLPIHNSNRSSATSGAGRK